MSNVPFWYRFAPFLGRPPELSKHQWKLLGLLSAVSFFEQYDMYLFSLNLTNTSGTTDCRIGCWVLGASLEQARFWRFFSQ